MLPPAPGGTEIIAESMLWLLLTGKIPTEAETRQLSRQLAQKGELPDYIKTLVDSYDDPFANGADMLTTA